MQPLPSRDLPDEVAPVVSSLNDLLARLRQALEAQRQFIADAAHELRSPLTAVRLQVQLLRRAESDAERNAALARLERGVHRSARLVQQLLTLARQEPETPEALHGPIDLQRLAREVVADFEPLAESREVTLQLERDEPVVTLGNGDSLRVMLSNLVDNALRYTPAGGAVKCARERQLDGEAVLEVEDTGPGIPPDQRERVFDRFYRVSGRFQGDEGSGLGLAIVKRVADLHAAKVALDNASSGSGLKVTVHFPHHMSERRTS